MRRDNLAATAVRASRALAGGVLLPRNQRAACPCRIGGQRPKYPEMPTKPFWGTHETILKQSGRTPPANDAAAKSQEAQMNHSIHSADRSTHLKIVVVALVAGIVVTALGISARTNSDYSQTAHVVKAGKLMTVTSSNASMVR